MSLSTTVTPNTTTPAQPEGIDRFGLAVNCARLATHVPELSSAACVALELDSLRKTFEKQRINPLDAAHSACSAIAQVYYFFVKYRDAAQPHEVSSWPPPQQTEAWNSIVRSLSSILRDAKQFVRLWKLGQANLEGRSMSNQIIQHQSGLEKALTEFEIEDLEAMWEFLEEILEDDDLHENPLVANNATIDSDTSRPAITTIKNYHVTRRDTFHEEIHVKWAGKQIPKNASTWPVKSSGDDVLESPLEVFNHVKVGTVDSIVLQGRDHHKRILK